MKFVAVDWGSTTLRAWLISEAGEILAQHSSDQGVFNLEADAFENTLLNACGKWLSDAPDTPIIMAGMIGSRSGWQETAYQTCPVKAETLGVNLLALANTSKLNLFVIPGIKTDSPSGSADVMRGEEVQIIGALAALQVSSDSSALICLPGTHSKWAQTRQQEITNFSTFFTGEIYSLLGEFSSIGAIMNGDEFDEASFREGLAYSRQAGGFLHHIFSVRARLLADTWSDGSLSAYLSGIAIGHEFQGAKTLYPNESTLYLIGNSHLQALYQIAASEFSFKANSLDAADAIIQGVMHIAQPYLKTQALNIQALNQVISNKP